MASTLTVASFITEGTGGGCTASVRYLSDGRVLVATDGNLTDLASSGLLADPTEYPDWQDQCTGAVFADVDAWGDGSDPVHETDGTLADVLAFLSAAV